MVFRVLTLAVIFVSLPLQVTWAEENILSSSLESIFKVVSAVFGTPTAVALGKKGGEIIVNANSEVGLPAPVFQSSLVIDSLHLSTG